MRYPDLKSYEGTYFIDARMAHAISALLLYSPNMREFIELTEKENSNLTRMVIKNTRFLSHSSEFMLASVISLWNGSQVVDLSDMSKLDLPNRSAFTRFLNNWRF